MFQSSLVPAMIGLSCSYDSWSVIVHPCLQMHAVLQLPFLPLLLIHDCTSLKNFNCSLYVNQTSCMSATICMYTACMSKYMHDSLRSHKYMPDNNQYMWIVFLVLVYKLRYGVQWYAANHAFVVHETGNRDLDSEWPCDSGYTLTLTPSFWLEQHNMIGMVY